MVGFMLFMIIKEITTGISDPKEEKEEEEVSSALSHGSPVSTARPSRSWRSSRSASAARQRDAENSRASRSKTGSLQLVCKSEPNTDQLEYGTWEAVSWKCLEIVRSWEPLKGTGCRCNFVSCMQTVAGRGVVLLGHEYLLPPALLALNVDEGILRQMSSLQRTQIET